MKLFYCYGYWLYLKSDLWTKLGKAECSGKNHAGLVELCVFDLETGCTCRVPRKKWCKSQKREWNELLDQITLIIWKTTTLGGWYHYTAMFELQGRSWNVRVSKNLVYSLSSSIFQSKVETEVWVMGGKGGCTILQTLGGGAGVRIVERDMRDMLDMPPGEVLPPSLDRVGLCLPVLDRVGLELLPPCICIKDVSSSSSTSSSIATLQ